MSNTLSPHYPELDSIDNELLRLLNRRARLATRLGRLCPVSGLPVGDDVPGQESLARACRANAGPLDEHTVAKIFRRIIHETHRADAPARTAHAPSGGWWGGSAPPHEELGELV